MSDYFANLVTRSFGAAPAIRPRLTSLFEPERREPAEAAEAGAARNEDTFREVEEEVAAKEPRASRSTLRGVQPPATAEREAEEEQAARPRAAVEEHRAARAGEDTAATKVERTERHETRVIAETRVLREMVERGETAPPMDLARERHLPAPAPGMAEPRTKAPEPEKPAAWPDARLTPNGRVPDLSASAQGERKQRERRREREDEAADTAEPSVQVTIGRIEVRASKESAGGAKPAGRSPVMSLDEYLRSRTRQVRT